MVDRTMRGLYPILAMPFDDQGHIDTEDLQREVEFALDNGAHGVGIALGSEIMMLSETERDLAITTVVGQANGRIPVVVNTGPQASEVAVQYSRNAEELGANAVMVIRRQTRAPASWSGTTSPGSRTQSRSRYSYRIRLPRRWRLPCRCRWPAKSRTWSTRRSKSHRRRAGDIQHRSGKPVHK